MYGGLDVQNTFTAYENFLQKNKFTFTIYHVRTNLQLTGKDTPTEQWERSNGNQRRTERVGGAI